MFIKTELVPRVSFSDLSVKRVKKPKIESQKKKKPMTSLSRSLTEHAFVRVLRQILGKAQIFVGQFKGVNLKIYHLFTNDIQT